MEPKDGRLRGDDSSEKVVTQKATENAATPCLRPSRTIDAPAGIFQAAISTSMTRVRF